MRHDVPNADPDLGAQGAIAHRRQSTVHVPYAQGFVQEPQSHRSVFEHAFEQSAAGPLFPSPPSCQKRQQGERSGERRKREHPKRPGQFAVAPSNLFDARVGCRLLLGHQGADLVHFGLAGPYPHAVDRRVLPGRSVRLNPQGSTVETLRNALVQPIETGGRAR